MTMKNDHSSQPNDVPVLFEYVIIQPVLLQCTAIPLLDGVYLLGKVEGITYNPTSRRCDLIIEFSSSTDKRCVPVSSAACRVYDLGLCDRNSNTLSAGESVLQTHRHSRIVPASHVRLSQWLTHHTNGSGDSDADALLSVITAGLQRCRSAVQGPGGERTLGERLREARALPPAEYVAACCAHLESFLDCMWRPLVICMHHYTRHGSLPADCLSACAACIAAFAQHGLITVLDEVIRQWTSDTVTQVASRLSRQFQSLLRLMRVCESLGVHVSPLPWAGSSAAQARESLSQCRERLLRLVDLCVPAYEQVLSLYLGGSGTAAEWDREWLSDVPFRKQASFSFPAQAVALRLHQLVHGALHASRAFRAQYGVGRAPRLFELLAMRLLGTTLGRVFALYQGVSTSRVKVCQWARDGMYFACHCLDLYGHIVRAACGRRCTAEEGGVLYPVETSSAACSGPLPADPIPGPTPMCAHSELARRWEELQGLGREVWEGAPPAVGADAPT